MPSSLLREEVGGAPVTLRNLLALQEVDTVYSSVVRYLRYSITYSIQPSQLRISNLSAYVPRNDYTEEDIVMQNPSPNKY